MMQNFQSNIKVNFFINTFYIFSKKSIESCLSCLQSKEHLDKEEIVLSSQNHPKGMRASAEGPPMIDKHRNCR